MNNDNSRPSVYETMSLILAQINGPQNQKNLNADLAAFRNSIGKDVRAIEAWSILFPLLPESYLGTGPLTKEERSILTCLQVYALGQQGTQKVKDDDSNSFGESLNKIRDRESDSMDKHFNAMVTSNTFDEFAYHLRQLFKIGKSKGIFSVNYARLANDLYWYQSGKDKQICLSWARDYYRPTKKMNSEASVDAEENKMEENN